MKTARAALLCALLVSCVSCGAAEEQSSYYPTATAGSGGRWAQLGIGGGGHITVAKLFQGKLFVGTDVGGAFISADRGATFQPLGKRGVGIEAFRRSHVTDITSDGGHVYVLTAGEIYRAALVSVTDTTAWELIPGPAASLDTLGRNVYPGMLSTITVVKRPDMPAATLYVGTGDRAFDDKGTGNLFIGTFAPGRGWTWDPKPIQVAQGASVETHAVYAINVHQTANNRIWVCTGNGVFFTRNAGASFSEFNQGLPELNHHCTDLNVNPSNSGDMFAVLESKGAGAATKGGVFQRLAAGGDVWIDVNGASLPRQVDDRGGTRFRRLVSAGKTWGETLYLGTIWGGGVFKRTGAGWEWLTREDRQDNAQVDYGWIRNKKMSGAAMTMMPTPQGPSLVFGGMGRLFQYTAQATGQNILQVYTNSLGSQWQTRGLDNTVARWVAVDKHDPDHVVIAVGDRTLYRSTNARSTNVTYEHVVLPVTDGHAEDGFFAVFHPEASGHGKSKKMFFGVTRQDLKAPGQGFIFESTYDGATWQNRLLHAFEGASEPTSMDIGEPHPGIGGARPGFITVNGLGIVCVPDVDRDPRFDAVITGTDLARPLGKVMTVPGSASTKIVVCAKAKGVWLGQFSGSGALCSRSSWAFTKIAPTQGDCTDMTIRRDFSGTSAVELMVAVSADESSKRGIYSLPLDGGAWLKPDGSLVRTWSRSEVAGGNPTALTWDPHGMRLYAGVSGIRAAVYRLVRDGARAWRVDEEVSMGLANARTNFITVSPNARGPRQLFIATPGSGTFALGL